jgi:probable rRNA maturation factor
MNQIHFFSEKISYSVRQKGQIREWISKAVKQERHALGELNFIICSDTYLRSVNKKFLNHDYFTDIITFPYSEPGSKEISGDIYISIDRVRQNAKDYGVSVSEELHRVMIHGVLHLCGYDDHTPDQKAMMRKREDYWLKKLNLN